MFVPLVGACGQISGSTTANQWVHPWSCNVVAATASALGDVAGIRALKLGASGILRNARIALSGAVGTGRSITFTLTVNGTDTAITVTIADPATTGSDLTHSVHVNRGDKIEWRVVQSSNTANIVTARYGLEFEGDNFAESGPGGGSGSTGPNTGATSYCPLWLGYAGTDFAWGASRDINHEDIAPVAGTITWFEAEVRTAPGAGKQWVFSIVKNGSEETSSRVTIANTALKATVTGLTIAIAEGDTVAVMAVPTGTPTGAAGVQWASGFTSTTDGQSPNCGHVANSGFNAATTQRFPLSGGYNSFDAVADRRNGLISHACDNKRLRWELATAPGASKTVTLAGRINDAATSNISIAIADPATTGSDLTHSDSLVAGDADEWQSTQTAGTTASAWRWASMLYVTPVATPTYARFGYQREHSAPL